VFDVIARRARPRESGASADFGIVGPVSEQKRSGERRDAPLCIGCESWQLSDSFIDEQ
jgi:hypothetical protein